MTLHLHEIILYVADMPSQVAFYRDVMGLRLTEPRDVVAFQDVHWVAFETGPCRLALHSGGRKDFGEDAPKFVFRVDEMERERPRLERAGVRIGPLRSPAPGVLVCDARDPEGNVFSLEHVAS